MTLRRILSGGALKPEERRAVVEEGFDRLDPPVLRNPSMVNSVDVCAASLPGARRTASRRA